MSDDSTPFRRLGADTESTGTDRERQSDEYCRYGRQPARWSVWYDTEEEEEVVIQYIDGRTVHVRPIVGREASETMRVGAETVDWPSEGGRFVPIEG